MEVRKRRLVAVLAVAVFVLCLLQAALFPNQAMASMFGFFKRYDVHLSPEVHGRVTFEGKPVPGLRVMRELTYEKEYLDKTVTDADGRFHFPEKSIRSRIPGRLFDETRNRQVIVVDYEGDRFLLWHTVTPQVKEPEQTVVEKLAKMDCELTTPEELQHFEIKENPSFTHNIHSICRWDN